MIPYQHVIRQAENLLYVSGSFKAQAAVPGNSNSASRNSATHNTEGTDRGGLPHNCAGQNHGMRTDQGSSAKNDISRDGHKAVRRNRRAAQRVGPVVVGASVNADPVGQRAEIPEPNNATDPTHGTITTDVNMIANLNVAFQDAEIIDSDVAANNAPNPIQRRLAADPNTAAHGLKTGTL